MGERPRRLNILVTGTPGTGKTTLAQEIANRTGMSYVNIGNLVKEKKLYSEKDETWDAFLIDEDQVIDEIESAMVQGFNVVDHHSCDFFPERYFALVVVLRTDTNLLYDRLQTRNYSKLKLDENMESEIMQVCLEEARESYAEHVVVELPSNTVADMESNLLRIVTWVNQNKNT